MTSSQNKRGMNVRLELLVELAMRQACVCRQHCGHHCTVDRRERARGEGVLFLQQPKPRAQTQS